MVDRDILRVHQSIGQLQYRVEDPFFGAWIQRFTPPLWLAVLLKYSRVWFYLARNLGRCDGRLVRVVGRAPEPVELPDWHRQ